MSEELKPCKHCGGEARVIECPQSDRVFIECCKCGIRTRSMLSRERVVADWNRSVTPENQRRKSGIESTKNGSAPASVSGGNKVLMLK